MERDLYDITDERFWPKQINGHTWSESESRRLFWEKVDVSGPGCWRWKASKQPSGYGQARRRGETITAHRLMWEYVYGAIPAGLCVLHRCDNRECVNPAHLFLGTKADNTADMMAKGRNGFVHGEAATGSRLTTHGVSLARRMAKSGIGIREIGRRFGVSHEAVRRAVNGATWRRLRDGR